MFKRLFFSLVGLGAGVTLGAWGLRKVEAAQRALAPDHLARSAGARAGTLSARVAAAVEVGRAAAATKEAELRGVYRVRAVQDPDAASTTSVGGGGTPSASMTPVAGSESPPARVAPPAPRPGDGARPAPPRPVPPDDLDE